MFEMTQAIDVDGLRFGAQRIDESQRQ